MKRLTLLILLALYVMVITTRGVSRTVYATSEAETILARMTLEQRVGQLFLVSVYGKTLPESTRRFIEEMTPGGVALFAYNGTTPQEVTWIVNAWQTVSTQSGANIPLLVAIDQEGGPVTRLRESDGYTALPAGWALGAMPPADAKTVAGVAGEQLRSVGITMNLAPVADVQTIPRNPLMDRRTFGAYPERTGAAVAQYTQGLQATGVIGVLKHFPGHGDAEDSHLQLPTISYDLARVNQIELAPFKMGIEAGVDAVMIGHLVYPALDPTPKLPASLSKAIITDLLKNQMGFQGVVVSDAMDMQAITTYYKPGEAAVLAVEAGMDILTTGPHMGMEDQRVMKRAVLEAVKTGRLPEARINDAALKILKLKEKYGLLKWTPLDVQGAPQRVNPEKHTETIRELYPRLVTIAKNKQVIPIDPTTHKTALIYPGIYPAPGRLCGAFDLKASRFAYSQSPTEAEIAASRKFAQNADRVVVFTYDALYTPAAERLLKAIPAEKLIVVALQNPYDLALVPEAAGGIAIYLPSTMGFTTACNALYGKETVSGTLPIQLTGVVLQQAKQ